MKREREKFDKALGLHKQLDMIRSDYIEDINSKNDQKRQQLGIITYLLDITAYRPGSQKGKETGIGIGSMRIKHITFKTNNKIHFEFKGKYCVEYCEDHQVAKRVYDLMKIEKFDKNKDQEDLVFDMVKYEDIRNHLGKYGITPKMIRTYHATNLFRNILLKEEEEIGMNSENAKNLISKAKCEVQKKLNHLHKKSGKSYIDPRIILAW